jgi:hypothetical protein
MYKIFTFFKSLFWHAYAGFPKSTQKLINARYDICNSCEYFEKNTCLVCGCNINNKRMFMNKLAWLDQKCPMNKW